MLTQQNFIVSYGNYNNSGEQSTDKNNNPITIYTPNVISITFINYSSITQDTYTYAYPFQTIPTISSGSVDISKLNTTEISLTMPINTVLNGTITIMVE